MSKQRMTLNGDEISMLVALAAKADPSQWAQARTRALIEKCKAAVEDESYEGTSFRILGDI
jgi:hypothetical protein